MKKNERVRRRSSSTTMKQAAAVVAQEDVIGIILLSEDDNNVVRPPPRVTFAKHIWGRRIPRIKHGQKHALFYSRRDYAEFRREYHRGQLLERFEDEDERIEAVPTCRRHQTLENRRSSLSDELVSSEQRVGEYEESLPTWPGMVVIALE